NASPSPLASVKPTPSVQAPVRAEPHAGAAAAASAPAKKGTDGIYAATDSNYRIEVRFKNGKLLVVEPNKTSEYVQRPDAPDVYEFQNPTNGIRYVLQTMNDGSLRAYKPESPQNFTTLKLVQPPAQAAGDCV